MYFLLLSVTQSLYLIKLIFCIFSHIHNTLSIICTISGITVFLFKSNCNCIMYVDM